MAEDRLENLKQKYQSVLSAIQQHGVRLQNVHIENNKLLIRGEAPSQDAKNRVWDQIKMVDPNWSSDLVADITVAAVAAQAPQTQAAGAGGYGGGAAQAGAGRTYTVKSGDTLSKIAREVYGDSSQYRKIFEANRDKLKDPDKIMPGQQLVIP